MKPQNLDSTNALLEAFDQVANSNSHLLVGEANDDLRESFRRFATCRQLKEELLNSDRARNWDNYHNFNEAAGWEPRSGEFYNGSKIEFSAELAPDQFRQQLVQLLNQGPCFHGKRLAETEAQKRVNDFCRDLLGANCNVLDVKPTFLYAWDPEDGEPPDQVGALPYFEGRGADHCFAWKRQEQLLVLLLNGCP